LESHEGFDEGGFAGGLMSHYDYGGGIEWLLKILKIEWK
jgi:hypothetical protein